MIILTEVSFKARFTSTDVGARGILTNSIIQAGIVYQTLIDVYVTVFPLPSDLALTGEGALSIDTQRIVLTQGRIQTLILILFAHIPLPARWARAGKSSRCVDTRSTILTDLHLTLVHINGTVGPLPLLCAATCVATEGVDTEATVLTDAHKLYTLIDIHCAVFSSKSWGTFTLISTINVNTCSSIQTGIGVQALILVFVTEGAFPLGWTDTLE